MITREEIIKQTNDALKKEFEFKDEQLLPAAQLKDDLGLDSLDAVDMVVIMVKHNHIIKNWDRLKGKIILDCHNICPLEGVYHI